MKRKLLIAIIFIVAIFFYGCSSSQLNASTTEGQENPTASDEVQSKLKVYTTLYPLEDFVKKIGSDYVEVENIIPPGADAHSYEPTTKNMTSIASGDAFIYNGLNMEPSADKIAIALEKENVKLIEATYRIDAINHEDEHEHEHSDEEHAHEDDAEVHEHEDEGHTHDDEEHEHTDEEHALEDGHDHDHGGLNPHVWLDPSRAITLAENIKNALVELNPDAKEEFEKNYKALTEELTNLDEEFLRLVESKENPEILVSHAAYGYWEERYGIKQIAVSGLSPSNEPSQRELKNIADIAKEKQIKYILFEQNVTSKIAEIVKNEIDAEPLYLYTMESVSEEERNSGEDYFSLMRKNLSTLEKALK
ncbi:zinc ABC transporter substrate-binding protein [Robertmurraya massiliosenegalensis]|uniref:metal ABC transporter solute-binding protein, Zn/Mn family n=1 Tax=Robertmurraya TaxID=2837507 RepID=UPI0039A5D5A5